MIELLILFSLIFLIYSFFYKQYSEEYSINQIDFNSHHTLKELLSEKNPIVIKGCTVPSCVLPSSLSKIQRFNNLLGNYLEKINPNIYIPQELQTVLANETGFHVYGEHTWKEKLYANSLSEYIITFKSKLCFGNSKYIKTKANYTLIIPICGTYICSIINPKYTIDAKQDNTTTTQYMDIILRQTKVLCLPSHWQYSMTEQEPYSYFGIYEYHEPISLLTEYLEKN
jgi:hypothetical protein